MEKKEPTNVQVEDKIKASITKITPDIIDSVISDCKDQKGVVIKMTEKKSSMKKRIIAATAALVLVLGGAVCFQGYSNSVLASVVSLDVNPSVEIKVNKNEKVLDVIAKNEDGKIIVGDMDFKGSTLEVTVNALIGSMLRNGYISEIQNSILISVDGKNDAESARLEEKLSQLINGLLGTEAFESAIVSQTVKSNSEIEALAEKYGITKGKAQLIMDLTAKDSTLSADDLAPLTINELTLMLESKTRNVDTVNVTGKASDKQYIGAEKAKSIALAHAGLSESSVKYIEVEFDHDDGIMLYEVEFRGNDRSYEYDINAVTGEIVKADKEYEDDLYDFDDDHKETNAQNSSFIGNEAAKAIAFKNAGVQEKDAFDIECELDTDDGRSYYEVEFKYGNREYKYDIDATNGSILKSEKEIDH